MTNLRPGIDTHPPDFFLLAKLNIPFDDRERVIAALTAIEDVRREKMDPTRTHGKVLPRAETELPLVVRDLNLHLLTGFGLRFFLGTLKDRKDDEAIPNFPPGGVFRPRPVKRFAIRDRNVPHYLRTMNATGDRDWIAKRLGAGKPGAPSAQSIDAAYSEWLSESEADLLLQIEANNLFLVVDLWDAVKRRVVDQFGLEVKSVQHGFNRGDGKDHTGFADGTSNLQERMVSDPLWYRSKIYLPHPAPAYPGEPDYLRDDPRYDGGTYLVHRKYLENLQLWNAGDFEVRDHYGHVFRGAEARRHAIGRDPQTGRVISRSNDQQLEHEFDGAEVNLGYNEGHVLKARGGVTAPFEGPFPPLKPGETNVFSTQDIRIRRRGVNFAELDAATGQIAFGLHFICFQNNIQQTGFEFINNIWLLNPLFRRSRDGLFNPDAGIIEPLEGAYYFVPPEHRRYPGEIFFE